MSYTVSASAMQQWMADKLDTQKIEEELLVLGLDEEAIAIHIKEFKKFKYAKRQLTGFICLGVGASLGFVSCLLSIINPVPELYYWFLYGLTSVAILVIFLGLYYVLEG